MKPRTQRVRRNITPITPKTGSLFHAETHPAGCIVLSGSCGRTVCEPGHVAAGCRRIPASERPCRQDAPPHIRATLDWPPVYLAEAVVLRDRHAIAQYWRGSPVYRFAWRHCASLPARWYWVNDRVYAQWRGSRSLWQVRSRYLLARERSDSAPLAGLPMEPNASAAFLLHSEIQRGPRGVDTPASAAASSLERPKAIACQNRRRFSRCQPGGRPGERKFFRVHRSEARR